MDVCKENLRELFEKERSYLNHFFDGIDLEIFEKVLKALVDCRGLIVLTGVGKSGLIAKKIAVTMISTGTRAFFLSPTNALHGDLGILKEGDLFLVLSKSGETEELLQLIPFVRNRGVKIIALVSESKSRLAKAADLVLPLPLEKELCPYDMAPTTSTTIQLIAGDILAIGLMKHKGFSREEFVESHPSGRIGKRNILKVRDLMLVGEAVPVSLPETRLMDTLVELSNKRCGCVIVRNEENKLLGIFTDGDLRRALQEKGSDALEMSMQSLMVKNPKTTFPDVLAFEAMQSMESDQKHPITVLPVVSEDGFLAGLIKMHDIVQSGI